MLTILWKSVRFVVGSLKPGDQGLVEDSSSTDADSQDGDLAESKVIYGRVTHLMERSSSGLINHSIYFSLKNVIGPEAPEVGSQVAATIYRSSSRHAWRAKSVSIVDELWGQEGNENQHKEAFAVVRKISGQWVETKEGFNFNLKDMDCDFVPFSGDVLLLKVNSKINGEEENYQVMGFRCSRSEEIQGTVTLINNKYGTINNEIWFEPCAFNLTLRKGDRVVAQVIESNQGKYIWRATAIVPKKMSRETTEKLEEMDDLFQDKKDISITRPLNFLSMSVGDCNYITAWIKNLGSLPRVLLSCQFVSCPLDPCDFTSGKPMREETGSESDDGPLVLKPGQGACVNLLCHAK